MELRNYFNKNPDIIINKNLRDYFINSKPKELISTMYEKFAELFKGEKQIYLEYFLGENFELPKYITIKK